MDDIDLESAAHAKALVEVADHVRDFPNNTCPASRHAQMIGEHLAKREPYPMLDEEPEHCAESILSTVASLYQARTELALTKAQSEYTSGLLGVEVSECGRLSAENERLREELKRALRQWSMYADACEQRDEFDLATEKSPEADLYRAAYALAHGHEQGAGSTK